MLVELALAGLVAGAAPPPSLPAGVGWSTPTPAWVEPIDAPALVDSSTPADVRERLLDDQVDVRRGRTTRFRRRIRQARTAAGLERVGDVRIDFNPAWERLDVHWVRVRRGAEALEPVRGSDVRLIQRERGLDDGLVDDAKTLVIFVPGLEVSDEVDVAFTTSGVDPALAGRFADRFSLAFPGLPIDRRSLRLLWRGDRELRVRTFAGAPAPRRRELTASTELTWDWRAPPPHAEEPRVPPWHFVAPTVQVSDFDSWAELARWISSSYEVPPPSEAMQAWLTEHRSDSPEQAFLQAVRFVRGEVRYLGVEVGENTLHPHPPAQVFEQRFGDCKDKALLLVALLEALGVRARAALVNTEWRRGLDRLLPTPFAFDHVIVRAEVAGEVRWVDATMPAEPGPFTSWRVLPRSEVLVLDPATEGLTWRERAKAEGPDIEVRELFDIDIGGHDVLLTVETTMRRGRAQQLRERLAAVGLAQVQDDFLEFERERFEKATVEAPLEIRDTQDELHVKEVYRLPNQEQRDTATDAWAVLAALEEVPDPESRATPLALPEPTHVLHVIEIEPKGTLEPKSKDDVIEGPGLVLKAQSTVRDKHAMHRFELITRGDHVPAADVPAHAEAVARARRAADFYYSWRIDEGALSPGAIDAIGIGVLAGFLGLVYLLVRTVSSLRRRARPSRRAR
jgi:hypothetical protein